MLVLVAPLFFYRSRHQQRIEDGRGVDAAGLSDDVAGLGCSCRNRCTPMRFVWWVVQRGA